MKTPATPVPLPLPHASNEEVDRPSRVSELVDKIAAHSDSEPRAASSDRSSPPRMAENQDRLSLHTDNTGNGLADFHNPHESSRDTGIRLETPVVRKPEPSVPFAPNPSHTAKLSNYRQSYETPMMRGGIPNGSYGTKGTNGSMYGGNIGNTHDGKVADRLSYIIHLLEEMKNEKTNNVMEEFVLYSLLGIFVIYLVDAFARTGKYTR